MRQLWGLRLFGCITFSVLLSGIASASTFKLKANNLTFSGPLESSPPGPCARDTCVSGTCECDEYNGSVSGALIGKSSGATLDLTC